MIPARVRFNLTDDILKSESVRNVSARLIIENHASPRRAEWIPPCNNFYRHLARNGEQARPGTAMIHARIRTFIGAVVRSGFTGRTRTALIGSVIVVVTERPGLSRRRKSVAWRSAGERCMYNVSVYVTGSHDRGRGLIFLPRPALRAGLP